MSNSHSNFYDNSKLFHGSMMHAMGTRLDVLIVGLTKDMSTFCWENIQDEIHRLSKIFNKFDAGSELAQLNNEAKSKATKVRDELWAILTNCKRYYNLTQGYFDISLKNFEDVILDSDKHTVRFQDSEIELDLGAYGKGYALEKIRPILLAHNVDCALINFGNSSVLALGTHPYGDSWPIGVENPHEAQQILGVVNLRDNTMSTSGNMPSHTKHIINPHTGVYIEGQKLISVKADNAIDAEVLSTTLLIAPEEEHAAITSNFILEEYYSFSF